MALQSASVKKSNDWTVQRVPRTGVPSGSRNDHSGPVSAVLPVQVRPPIHGSGTPACGSSAGFAACGSVMSGCGSGRCTRIEAGMSVFRVGLPITTTPTAPGPPPPR